MATRWTKRKKHHATVYTIDSAQRLRTIMINGYYKNFRPRARAKDRSARRRHI